MGQLLKTILEGIQQVLVLSPDQSYIIPKRGDFSLDAHNLRSDVNRVAKDIRQGVKKYGKADHRKSQKSA